MLKTILLEICCTFCRRWFPSPLTFAYREAFNLPALFASVTRCPHCGLETASDSDNFRARFEDGSTLGRF
jgi:hypothetical protein